jgi:MFS family permease
VHRHEVEADEIAVCVVVGRTAEFFDFFVYAIASILVFPKLVFSFVDPLTGTLYSFAVFAIAFIARPFGTLIFTAIDRDYGRGVKLTVALLLLGGSTAAVAFLPGYSQVGLAAIAILAVLRIGQGLAMGGAWDGLASLLALNAPEKHRGWYAMIPQLGAFLGLAVASGLFGYFSAHSSAEEFIDWGWRYPFYIVAAVNIIALFVRLRMSVTPGYVKLYKSHELQPETLGETVRAHGRTILIGAFVPLASFALFHIVTVFPFAWVVLFTSDNLGWFLTLQMIGAACGVLAVVASGVISDRVGRRMLLGVTAAAIAVFSCFAPMLLGGSDESVAVYMIVGFVLLGLSFGQASGAIASNFPSSYRYTGSALTTDLTWLFGAGFAPLVALFLASQFGLVMVGVYLLSGAVCTLAALALNRRFAVQIEDR